MSINNKVPLVLRSSKVVNERAPPMSAGLRWTTPHPGLRPDVELFCGDPRSQFDFLGVGEALSRQSLAPKTASTPRLLEVEPARPYGYEDLLHARVVFQPRPD